MRVSILIFFISVISVAQNNGQHHYRDLVECYYNKDTSKPLFIYNTVGGKIVDTLYNIEDKNSWYKIAIIDNEYGWFKIKNIQRLPSSYQNFPYENHWVRSSNFLINIDNYDPSHHVYLYDLPSTEANKIHKMDNFDIVNLIEVSGLWSKVNLNVGKKKVEGWLHFRDQCAYPWTTCPKYE